MKWTIMYDAIDPAKRLRLPCVKGDESCYAHKVGSWCRWQLLRTQVEASSYEEACRLAVIPEGHQIFTGWNQDEVDALAKEES